MRGNHLFPLKPHINEKAAVQKHGSFLIFITAR